MATKVGLVGEFARSQRLLFVLDRQRSIALRAGKAGYADGVDGTISISSVREKNNGWSGHRGALSW